MLNVRELVFLDLETARSPWVLKCTTYTYFYPVNTLPHMYPPFSSCLLTIGGSKISGTSNLGDWPVTGERIDTKIYSDIDDDIFDIEMNFPDSHSPVREVDM